MLALTACRESYRQYGLRLPRRLILGSSLPKVKKFGAGHGAGQACVLTYFDIEIRGLGS